MRLRVSSTGRTLVLLGSVAFALGCRSHQDCSDYVTAEGFGSRSMVSVRIGETVKNINDQHEALLDVLRDSAWIEARPVEPAYTIELLTGGSWESQKMLIQVGEDGDGVIEHVGDRVFFHCSRWPGFARAAFDRSTIVLR